MEWTTETTRRQRIPKSCWIIRSLQRWSRINCSFLNSLTLLQQLTGIAVNHIITPSQINSKPLPEPMISTFTVQPRLSQGGRKIGIWIWGSKSSNSNREVVSRIFNEICIELHSDGEFWGRDQLSSTKSAKYSFGLRRSGFTLISCPGEILGSIYGFEAASGVRYLAQSHRALISHKFQEQIIRKVLSHALDGPNARRGHRLARKWARPIEKSSKW